MADPRPEDFDWVSARFRCAADVMLGTLRDQAKANVEKYCQLAGTDRFKFESTEGVGRYTFKVWDTEAGRRERRAVDFEWKESVLEIATVDSKTLQVSFVLDVSGDCKYLMNGDTLDAWQVLRVALEPLFFR